MFVRSRVMLPSLALTLASASACAASQAQRSTAPSACGYPPNPPCPAPYPNAATSTAPTPTPMQPAPPSTPPRIGPAVTPFGWMSPWTELPVSWDALPIPWIRGIPGVPYPDPRSAPSTPSMPPEVPTPPSQPAPSVPPPTQPPSPDGWPAAWSRFEDEVIADVNARRGSGAMCGDRTMPAVPPLQPQPSLRAAAHLHTLDMADHDFVEHNGSDGSQPQQRIYAAGYRGATTGENVAGGYPTPRAVVDEWMKSPGHCFNIMHSGFGYVGVGFVERPDRRYRYYWTQTFGG